MSLPRRKLQVIGIRKTSPLSQQLLASLRDLRILSISFNPKGLSTSDKLKLRSVLTKAHELLATEHQRLASPGKRSSQP